MKNIVIIYLKDDADKTIPFSREVDRNAFEELQTLSLKNGFKMYRASIKWYNHETGLFEKSWHFDGKNWLKENNIKPDFIYDRTPSRKDAVFYDKKIKMQKNCAFFNSPLFRLFFGNKGSQYAYFKDFMPKSVLVDKESELKNSLNELNTEKVVVKPLYGSGGFNITIELKEKIIQNINKIKFPVIIQEMVNGQNGIKGISDTLADLRLVFVDHKFIYACSRIAKKGSLFTNFHQGAKMVVVPEEKIPSPVFKITEKIQETLRIFKKADYSLDFLFEKDRPILIEMNTTPGVDYFSPQDYKTREKYFLAILNSFAN